MVKFNQLFLGIFIEWNKHTLFKSNSDALPYVCTTSTSCHFLAVEGTIQTGQLVDHVITFKVGLTHTLWFIW